MALARSGIALALRMLQRTVPAHLQAVPSWAACIPEPSGNSVRNASWSSWTAGPSCAACAGTSQLLPGHLQGSSILAYVQSRGYKFHSPHIMQVVKAETGRKKLTHNQVVGRAAASLQRSVLESKLPDGWKRRRFFIKPKYQRQNTLRMGIMKRKRSEFNYKLKWALTTMARCAPLVAFSACHHAQVPSHAAILAF